MKHSKVQRAGIHAALVAAKPGLWNGRGAIKGSRYICFALKGTDLPYVMCARLEVMRRLGDFSAVQGYLRKHVGVPERLLTDPNIQGFRHLWVDSLIKEFAQ